MTDFITFWLLVAVGFILVAVGINGKRSMVSMAALGWIIELLGVGPWLGNWTWSNAWCTAYSSAGACTSHTVVLDVTSGFAIACLTLLVPVIFLFMKLRE
jgi:hypothetical protein